MISYYCTRTGNEQGMRMLDSTPPEICIDSTRYCELPGCGKAIPKPQGMAMQNYAQKKFCSLSCNSKHIARNKGRFSK